MKCFVIRGIAAFAVLALSAGLALDYAALAPAAQTSPADVAAIQVRLADLGYLPAGGVNGSLDARTRQAIIAFQGWQGLARTGAAGPAMLARLATAARPRPFPDQARASRSTSTGRSRSSFADRPSSALSTYLPALPERRPRQATSASTERNATPGRFRSPCGFPGPAISRAEWPFTGPRRSRRIPPHTVACAFRSRRRRLSTRSPGSEFGYES